MTILQEGIHTAEFIVSEANGSRSRDTVTLAQDNDLVAGAVLGKVSASGEYTEHDPSAADGSETAAAVLYDAVDSTGEAMPAVIIARDAEVDGALLTYIDGISQANKDDAISALADHHIIVR